MQFTCSDEPLSTLDENHSRYLGRSICAEIREMVSWICEDNNETVGVNCNDYHNCCYNDYSSSISSLPSYHSIADLMTGYRTFMEYNVVSLDITQTRERTNLSYEGEERTRDTRSPNTYTSEDCHDQPPPLD